MASKTFDCRPGGTLFTSDWHCGLSLKGKSRDEEIAEVLNDLTDKAVALAPKSIVVAGDLSESFRYPGSVPSKMIGRALYKMAEEIPGARVFVIPGNHDWDGLDLIALSEKSNIHFIRRPAAIEIGEKTYLIAVPYMRKHNLGAKTYDDIIGELADSVPEGSRCVAAVHAAFEGTVPGLCEPAVTAQALNGPVKKLFLGHIHMHKQLSPDVFYTGALIRNTFGEEMERSGMWYLDDNFRVTDIPLSGARRMETVSFENSSAVMDGDLEGELVALIANDPDIMIRIRIPGASAFAEQITEIVKRVEEEYSEPGRNVIVSDFAMAKTDREKHTDPDPVLDISGEPGAVKDIAELISVKSLWSGYCREKLESGGITESELAAVEVCGEALLAGAEAAEIWESMKAGKFTEISQMTETKTGEDEPVPVMPSGEPIKLNEEDLEDIELDIDM